MAETRLSLSDALAALRADVDASLATDGEARGGAAQVGLRLLFTTRLQAVLLLRLGQWLAGVLPPAAIVVKYLNNVLTGADIALQAQIGPGLRLFHPSGVVIGPRCVVGANCTLMQHCSLGESQGGSPRLGDRVFLGAGAAIFGAIDVGDDAIVGANAVVTKHVAANTMVGGVPARVLRDENWSDPDGA